MNSMIQTIVLLIMIINGDSHSCWDQEHLPFCICRSSDQHAAITDLFLAKLLLLECNNSLPDRHCHRNEFSPPSLHLAELIPSIANQSHCLNEMHCLHALHSIESCQQCQVTPLPVTNNNTNRADNLPSAACYHLCPHDTSCGFFCLNENIAVSIDCDHCRENRHNISCRCIKTQQPVSCLQSSDEVTNERWMHKSGIPAAGFLALLILAVVLLVIVIKLIYCQFDRYERRHNGSFDHSISINQSLQPLYRCSNTLSISPLRS